MKTNLFEKLSSSKGFTLIELLIVIAVIGVLAAGVLVAINPLQQIRRANDTKIRSDIGQLTQAAQAFYTLNQFYPVNLAALVTSGDIKQVPTPPGGGAAAYNYSRTAGTACTTAPFTNCEAQINLALQAPLAVGNLWCWRSVTNAVGEVTAAVGCAP